MPNYHHHNQQQQQHTNETLVLPTLQMLASVWLQESGMILMPMFGAAAVHLWYVHWPATEFLFIVGIGICIFAITLFIPPKSNVVLCYWWWWWLWVVYNYGCFISQVTGEPSLLLSLYALSLHIAFAIAVGLDIVGRDVMREWRLAVMMLLLCTTSLVPIPYGNLFWISFSSTLVHAAATSVLILVLNIRERQVTNCTLYEQRLHSLVQIHCALFTNVYIAVPVALFVIVHAWRHDLEVTRLKDTTCVVLQNV